MESLNSKLMQGNAIYFRRCLDNCRRSVDRRAWDQALGWAACAGKVAWKAHPGFYVSCELESLLVDVGRQLHERPAAPVVSLPAGRRRWLHLITSAHNAGGHTRFVERWIRRHSDVNDDVHSVLLLEQRRESPPVWLQDTVESTGGRVLLLETSSSLADRALQLRSTVRSSADVVVQHVHPNDPLPSVAFAADDLPPVLLLNHADHVFWTGLSSTDRVVDIRLKGQALTCRRRTSTGLQFLPIPLIPRPLGDKEESRQKLGLPNDKVIILSIGGAYKFSPYGGLSFTETLTKLCQSNDNILVLVIGPPVDSAEWKHASAMTGNKLRALGPIRQIEDYYHACDIYLDSFPIGSLTASLDAALYGVPVIMSPCTITPLLGIDHAYDGMDPPQDSLDGYLEFIGNLASDPKLRQEKGARQHASVSKMHAGSGWNQCLEALIKDVPSFHSTNLPSQHDIGIIDKYDALWADLQAAHGTSIYSVFRGALRQSKHNLPPTGLVVNKAISYMHQYSRFFR